MARIYVGTYHKYNCGSIEGEWLDCEDYSSMDEFYEACAELHKNEDDPELMFQDWEDIPTGMVSESHVDADLWDWLALEDDDQELLSVYREFMNQEGTIDEARESYGGQFDSEEEWAAVYAENCGMLISMPEELRGYFDFAAYARDCEIGGDMSFVRHCGKIWAFSAR
jgi:antirestriction protein